MSDMTPAPIYREFITPDGDILVYDFKALKIPQIQAAYSIFTLYNERLGKVPTTNAERSLFELDNTLPRALGHLLRRKVGGVVQPYDMTAAQEEILPMINALEANEWPRLQEVKRDFFTRVKLQDAASMSRFERLLPMLAKVWSGHNQRTSQPSDAEPEPLSSNG